ncbi:MAG: serine/threonine protein kinase [Myxococcales bacterium]|nr:serine/threonine protein kinase [Myxococcales bacterium]
MESLDGCDLRSFMARQNHEGRRIEIAHSIYIMIECCRALDHAQFPNHPDTGKPSRIPHRDVSPPNILISNTGEVRLGEFTFTRRKGFLKGQFSYLSPEAASGLECDRRSEVFALGVILWEMLTGQGLFWAETDYRTVELVRAARVPSIATVTPDVDAELEAVVRKALAKNPDDRYESATDLGDVLAHYLFSHRLNVSKRDIANLLRAE